jgi:glycosyltransferase involved in cell wall biosynthesis
MIAKKVLFISNSIVGKNPGVSGGESRFIELGKCWKNMGYEIHLLSSEGGKNLCEKMGLPVILHKIPSTDSETRLEVLRRLFSLMTYIPNLLNEFKEGIVYSTSEQIYDTWPGFFLKIFYGKKIKFVSAVHWLPPIFFWQRKASKWYNSLLFMLSERSGLFLAYIFADALFPVSKSTSNDMYDSFLRGKKIHIVKCGVNLIEIENVRNKFEVKKTYDAVFMKRIQAVKGIFDLIDIWELVIKKLPESKLIIIGSGIDEFEAKASVSRKNLNNNIEFLGAIYDTERKYRYVSQSKLFLLPSYEENWAIVIGEALACGTPVLVYRLRELEEVWEDSITYIDIPDKNLFAETVVNFLGNLSKYDETVKHGLDFVKQYDWQQIADDEIKFIVGER